MQTRSETLQALIDRAIARSFIYRFLAKAFEDPNAEGWAALTDSALQSALRFAVAAHANGSPALEEAADSLLARLRPDQLESFTADYNSAFGHAARGLCPLNEIEYGDLKADPLFQPHRLADLAAFYHAFGLEVTPDAGERQDHICLELEFLSVLAAKQAYALEHQLDDEILALCADSDRKFLREHLARWAPAFTRRLARTTGEASALSALAGFTRAFIIAECARFGVAPGGEDLLLRPVDAAAESLCASCRINSLPPGALASTPQL